MYMKKLAALLLGAALTLSVVSCGGTAASSAGESSKEESSSAESSKEESKAESSEVSSKSEGGTLGVAADQPIEYSFLKCWNGGAAVWPDGWQEGQLAKYITEQFGVQLNVETITSSETEKLAMMFASGDVSDVSNVPFWNTNPGGEGEQVMNAALGGMLLGLNDYLDKYPEIKRACTENISTAFKELHYERPEFNGERYVIPNKPKTDEDNTNWAYGVFARKDILESLGVKSTDITNADQLYDYLKKVNEGGFTDINGKPVIPGTNWHNGWSYEQYVLSFNPGGFTNWDVVDGKIVHERMTQNELDKILYMQKLVSEGLYDAEALTQTDTMGKEKMATGRAATQGCHWPHMNGFFESTLYLTNPEMEYIPLGPFVQQDGTNPTSVYRKGAYGFGGLIISSEIKDPDRLLEVVNYLSSTEGRKLATFGIEGVHYNDENGVPVRTEEWTKLKSEDQQKYNLEGFGWGDLSVEDCAKSEGWDLEYLKPGYVTAREVRPIAYFDGYTADDISAQWEGKADFDAKMATVDYEQVKKTAITAATPEEATKIMEDYRTKMKEAGYDDMMAYVQEKMDADPSIVY